MKTSLAKAAFTVVLGIGIPAVGYLSLAGTEERSTSFVEIMDIDPDTFDVVGFQDTLSPRTAWRHGFLSRYPATEVVAVVVTSSGCVGSQAPEF